MTRGTFYLILSDCFWRSVEFNGDMYPEGYGDRALSLLKKVRGHEAFGEMVTDFNRSAHAYPDEELFWRDDLSVLEPSLDLTNEYFKFWFSDWIFIKNLSGKPIVFTTYRDETESDTIPYVLQDGKSVRFYFGRRESRNERK